MEELNSSISDCRESTSRGCSAADARWKSPVAGNQPKYSDEATGLPVLFLGRNSIFGMENDLDDNGETKLGDKLTDNKWYYSPQWKMIIHYLVWKMLKMMEVKLKRDGDDDDDDDD